jgi:hypothetical protein
MKYLALVFVFLGVMAHAVPTTLTVVSSSETAATFADTAADTVNGNQFKNPSCDVLLLLRNSHATDSSTVTIDAPSATYTIPGYGSMGKTDASVVLAAGAHKYIGPFPCATWNNSGYVVMSYTGTGTVLVTPVRVPKQ